MVKFGGFPALLVKSTVSMRFVIHGLCLGPPPTSRAFRLAIQCLRLMQHVFEHSDVLAQSVVVIFQLGGLMARLIELLFQLLNLFVAFPQPIAESLVAIFSHLISQLASPVLLQLVNKERQSATLCFLRDVFREVGAVGTVSHVKREVRGLINLPFRLDVSEH